MEASGENMSLNENEKKALEGLLDAFDNAFSLREIASAYCQAGRNAELASEILYNSQGSTSSSATFSSNFEGKGEESSESSYGNFSDNSSHENGDPEVSKQKKCTVSMGTVSGFLGKDYTRSTPLINGSSVSTKPMIIDLLPMPKTVKHQTNSASTEDDDGHKDMEDFLFNMLGDGFQLDRDAIQAVLSHCGYDMQKSMDELLNFPALNLEERNDDLGGSTIKLARDSDHLQQGHLGHSINTSNGDRNSNESKKQLSRAQKKKKNIEMEILASLFSAPETPEQFPERSRPVTKRSKALGEVVVEPPKDTTAEQKTHTVYLEQDVDKNDVHEEDNYEVLRRAMKEYQAAMKEYYKAAVDAYADGDHVRAGKLLEQGHFFHKKVREAREEAAQNIFKIRDVETNTQDTLTLDLHDYGAKEAIRLLKFHLSTLSAFKFLKVIIETNDEDITKGVRKRRIMKILENESIKWVEEGNAGTILICMDDIDPKRLSFSTKSTL